MLQGAGWCWTLWRSIQRKLLMNIRVMKTGWFFFQNKKPEVLVHEPYTPIYSFYMYVSRRWLRECFAALGCISNIFARNGRGLLPEPDVRTVQCEYLRYRENYNSDLEKIMYLKVVSANICMCTVTLLRLGAVGAWIFQNAIPSSPKDAFLWAHASWLLILLGRKHMKILPYIFGS